MARPKASAKQQLKAFEYWKSGFPVRGVHHALIQEFGDQAVSTGTVGNWFKSFKQGNLLHGQQDQPFTWAAMGTHGIPYEAGSVLLKINAVIRDFEENWPHFIDRKTLSFRDAKWMWRVYLAVEGNVTFTQEFSDARRTESRSRPADAPKLWGFEEWLLWGVFFSEAERAEEIVGIHVDTRSYEDALTYRSWESEENLVRYNELVAKGAIDESDESIEKPYEQMVRANQLYERASEANNDGKEDA